MTKQQAIAEIENEWASPRFAGVERNYTAEDVYRIRGSVKVEHSLARMGAEKLWERLKEPKQIAALGALTGNQAVQMAQAGLKAIYLSGWQVAADANTGGQMYPDQSLYPSNSVPQVVRNINNALLACRPGRAWRRPELDRLDAADRGRRRGGIRRLAQRV